MSVKRQINPSCPPSRFPEVLTGFGAAARTPHAIQTWPRRLSPHVYVSRAESAPLFLSLCNSSVAFRSASDARHLDAEMSHSPSPPRTPRLPARALTYQPYSPLRAAAQNFEMNPERQVPLPFRPVAREVGSTPRAYAPVENGLISPLMTSFDEDGERTDSTELSKRFAAHESLYDEPSDSNEEWG